jgi:hypothetical protein
MTDATVTDIRAAFKPEITVYALSSTALIVCTTRVEGSFKAYAKGVPGMDHRSEAAQVLQWGDDIGEDLARFLFPQYEDLPYAR